MKNVTFTLNNIDEIVWAETAKHLDYKDQIDVVASKQATKTYAEYQAAKELEELVEVGAYEIFPQVQGTEPTSDVVLSYKLKTKIANPETVDDFFNKLFKEWVNEKIIHPMAKAANPEIITAQKTQETALEDARTALNTALETEVTAVPTN